jgi:hypothetical protein
MIKEAEILQRLDAIADNELSVWDFSDWLVSHSINMHADSEQSEIELASDALRLFAEYDLGLSDTGLRDALLNLRNKNKVLRVHIMISGENISRYRVPIPANSSQRYDRQMERPWIPELVEEGCS